MGLKSYPAYKNSRAEWMGKVPNNWHVSPIKRFYQIRLGKMLQPQQRTPDDCEVPYLKAKHVQWFDVRMNDADTMWANQNEIDRYEVLTGDLLVCEGGEGGRCGIVAPSGDDPNPCIIQNALHRVRPRALANGTRISRNDYLQYVMSAIAAAGWFDSLNDKATIAHFTAEKFGALLAPVPPLPEQAAIVRFLDYADRRIRRYIRAKQKLIALLEEQKQAVIHQAVTGQIDVQTGQPYPSYKDSGVEWLGEVPEHWGWCRLRNVVSVVTTGSRGWSSYASDTGPLFIRVANLSRGSLKLRFDDVVRLDLPNTSEAHRTRIKTGDLLISVTAYIGSVGVIPEEFEEAYVSQHVARCQPSPESCSQWIGYVLLSMIGQTHGQMSLYGGTKDGLSLDDVKNYPILLPPRSEQEQAVRWIEDKLSSLVRADESAKRQIEMVREYRTRLIADVVTGKLDVREAAAKLPEIDPLADESDADDTPDTEAKSAVDELNSALEEAKA